MTKSEEKKETKRQIELIIAALVRAGAVPKYYKLGIPVLRKGEFHCKIGDDDFIIWLACYNEVANVWRITVQDDKFGPYLHELTYHASEVDGIGEGLYVLLLSKTIGHTPVWPLFALDTSYPEYAWSTLATEAYNKIQTSKQRFH